MYKGAFPMSDETNIIDPEQDNEVAQEMAEPAKPKEKWGALGYKPVPGLINRVISRYLRGERKKMRRFFAERGMDIYVLRLDALRRNPRMSMLEKNKAFQEILNDYAQQVTGARTSGAEQTTPTLQPVVGSVDLRDQPEAVTVEPVEGGLGVSADTAGSV